MFDISKSKKLVVGYLFTGKKICKEDRLFLKLAKKKNISLVMFNLFRKMDDAEFERRVRQCDIVYNNTAEDFVIESLKTVEEYGKTVIDNSKIFYYTEDKWMFHIKCREYNIPDLDTILLTNNLNIARAELKEFGRWPVVIKRIYGTMGEFVKKADNLDQALKIIKHFWKIDCDRLSVIAQEFVKSPSYRVTLINKKIVQTAIKTGKGWKCTGVYGKKFRKFRVDKALKKILKRLMAEIQIHVCGVDLLKKDGRWLVLEVNSDPALDFIPDEHEKLVGLVLDFVKMYHEKHKRRPSAKNDLGPIFRTAS